MNAWDPIFLNEMALRALVFVNANSQSDAGSEKEKDDEWFHNLVPWTFSYTFT